MRSALTTLAALALLAPAFALAPAAPARADVLAVAVTHEEQIELEQLPTLEPSTSRNANVERQLPVRLVARGVFAPAQPPAAKAGLSGLVSWLHGTVFGTSAERPRSEAEATQR